MADYLSPKDLDELKVDKGLYTTNGDIVCKDGSGVLAPIHPGTQGQVLTIGINGLPSYADPQVGDAPASNFGVFSNGTTSVTATSQGDTLSIKGDGSGGIGVEVHTSPKEIILSNGVTYVYHATGTDDNIAINTIVQSFLDSPTGAEVRTKKLVVKGQLGLSIITDGTHDGTTPQTAKYLFKFQTKSTMKTVCIDWSGAVFPAMGLDTICAVIKHESESGMTSDCTTAGSFHHYGFQYRRSDGRDHVVICNHEAGIVTFDSADVSNSTNYAFYKSGGGILNITNSTVRTTGSNGIYNAYLGTEGPYKLRGVVNVDNTVLGGGGFYLYNECNMNVSNCKLGESGASGNHIRTTKGGITKIMNCSFIGDSNCIIQFDNSDFTARSKTFVTNSSIHCRCNAILLQSSAGNMQVSNSYFHSNDTQAVMVTIDCTGSLIVDKCVFENAGYSSGIYVAASSSNFRLTATNNEFQPFASGASNIKGIKIDSVNIKRYIVGNRFDALYSTQFAVVINSAGTSYETVAEGVYFPQYANSFTATF